MEKIKAPTRKEMFTRVSDFLAEHEADTALIDFINHQIELLDNKRRVRSSPRSRKKMPRTLMQFMSRWHLSVSTVPPS